MEENRKVINIARLRHAIDQLLLHIENDLQQKEVELTEDYYWNIQNEELYLSNEHEFMPTIGSLFDDHEHLMTILENKDQTFSLMLIHAAPLLRFLAFKIGK